MNQVPVCDKWRCISWVEVAPGPQRRTRRFAAPLPPHSGTESPPQVDAGTGRTAARFALAYTRSPTRWAAATPRSECGRPASTPGPTRGSEFVMRRHRIVTREGASTTNPRVRGGTLRLSSQPPSRRISRPGRGGRTRPTASGEMRCCRPGHPTGHTRRPTAPADDGVAVPAHAQ